MIIPKERLLTQEDIKREYLALRDIYNGMVGNLYPNIAYDELLRLAEMYDGNDLPSVRPPLPSGYVL